MTKPFDVAIIGGGPGGYVAAIRAKQLGLSTALIESEHLGGICLNWGCIPTKALLKSSHLFHMAHTLHHFGISTGSIQVEIKSMVERSRGIANQLAAGIQTLLKKNGVEVFKAFGRLEGKTGDCHRIGLSDKDGRAQTLESKNVILATGARPRTLFSQDLGLWSSREAMLPQSIPASLLVIGAGAIGIEFASFYAALGTQVTVVEQSASILPVEDSEISQIAQKELVRQGIHFHTQSTVQTVLSDKKGYEALIKGPQDHVWKGERILIAIGVVGNTENLGLEGTKVKVHQGNIVTHHCSHTDEPGVYAIGDVAGAPWLAHKASHEGMICVESIAGMNPHPLHPHLIPGCVYSSPQIASIGLTEKQALDRGDIKVGRFPFAANGQALSQGESTGLVKVIFDKTTGELLGAHMVGHQVSELISSLTIAKTMEATEQDLKHVIFPHPTLSEMIHEAVLDADGQALHIFRKS
jgi:dihydrolipoamide dehydrogenase